MDRVDALMRHEGFGGFEMIGPSGLAALLAGAVMVATGGVAHAQMPSPLPAEALVDAPDAAKVAFLKAHVVASGPVTGSLAFDFPAAFYDNRLYLLGESHGVAAPQVLDLELLTHLNRRIGLRDYVAEVDPIQGARLNQYLETGEEAVLDRVFDFWTKSGAQWGNTAFEAKVRGVRALNQALPADRRIQFIGIDAVQDWPLLAAWVAEQGGQADLAALAGATTNAARAALARGWLATVPASPLTSRLVERLKGVLEGTSEAIGREAVIFDTYAKAVTSGELGDRPAYGLRSLFHVIQGGVNTAQPFAARVAASDLPTARKIVTLAVLSLDSAVQIIAATCDRSGDSSKSTKRPVDRTVLRPLTRSRLTRSTSGETGVSSRNRPLPITVPLLADPVAWRRQRACVRAMAPASQPMTNGRSEVRRSNRTSSSSDRHCTTRPKPPPSGSTSSQRIARVSRSKTPRRQRSACRRKTSSFRPEGDQSPRTWPSPSLAGRRRRGGASDLASAIQSVVAAART